MRASKVFWAALAAGLLGPAAAPAAPITYSYSFTTPTFSTSPSTAFQPAPDPVYGPGPTATGFAAFPLTGSALSQSVFGLGVFTTGEQNTTLAAFVDNIGGGTNPNGEGLGIQLTATNPNLGNLRVTSLTALAGPGAGPDFELFLNATSLGKFDATGGVPIVFATPISFTSGDTLFFAPLTADGTTNYSNGTAADVQSHGFAVSALVVQADVVPEPATAAVFGLLAVAGGWYGRRRAGAVRA